MGESTNMRSKHEHQEEEHVQEILKSIQKKVPESAAFGGKDFSNIYTKEYLKEKKRTAGSSTRVSKGRRRKKTTTTKKGNKTKRTTTLSRRTK